jgi:hypothetical protein
VIGFDGVTIDSVDRLHQTLDASRIHKDCMLQVLRGGAAGQPLYLAVRPGEQGGGKRAGVHRGDPGKLPGWNRTSWRKVMQRARPSSRRRPGPLVAASVEGPGFRRMRSFDGARLPDHALTPVHGPLQHCFESVVKISPLANMWGLTASVTCSSGSGNRRLHNDDRGDKS